jgi:voltage-gated potassium channel
MAEMTEPADPAQKSASRLTRGVAHANVVDKSMTRFMRKPPSVQTAARVIVTVMAVVVVISGILMWLLDHKEYPNVFVALWWAMQTVTTVGYGDVTPKEPAGRIVATFVMLEGIAFLAIVTAMITSTFVARAQRERLDADGRTHDAEEQRVHDRFDELGERLERLENLIRDQRGDTPAPR